MAHHGNTTHLQDLLDLAAAGIDDAYGELVAQASERLLKLTRRMLQDFPRVRRWEQTDDVFQTAALRLHQSLAAVRPDSVRGFFGLATTQIRRTLIDLARHHFGPEGQAAKHHTDQHGNAADDGLLANQLEASADSVALDSWTSFHEALDDLPDEEREVFHLLWYGGLSQSDAASLLGISIPTVQKRWYRAQRRLGKMMRGQLPSIEDK